MFIEDRYDVEIDDTISFFEFVSEGKNGKIPKLVYLWLPNTILSC